MAQFTYNGDEVLVYPDLTSNGSVLVAVPGETYELDEAPDARWSAVATQTASEAPSAPATPTPDPTPTQNEENA